MRREQRLARAEDEPDRAPRRRESSSTFSRVARSACRPAKALGAVRRGNGRQTVPFGGPARDGRARLGRRVEAPRPPASTRPPRRPLGPQQPHAPHRVRLEGLVAHPQGEAAARRRACRSRRRRAPRARGRSRTRSPRRRPARRVRAVEVEGRARAEAGLRVGEAQGRRGAVTVARSPSTIAPPG